MYRGFGCNIIEFEEARLRWRSNEERLAGNSAAFLKVPRDVWLR